MKELLPLKDVFAVQVPEGANDFKLSRDHPDEATYVSFKVEGKGNYRDGFDIEELLQPENYEILFQTKSATEEEWSRVVGKEWFEDDSEYWYIYEPNGMVRANLFFDTAAESGESLLRSHSLDIDSNYLIIKKK